MKTVIYNSDMEAKAINIDTDTLRGFLSESAKAILKNWVESVQAGADPDEAMHTTNIFLVAQAEIACEKAETDVTLNRAAIDKVKEIILDIAEA